MPHKPRPPRTLLQILSLCGFILLPLLNGCEASEQAVPTAALPTVTPSVIPTRTLTPTLTPAPTPTATQPRIVCGESPTMFILLIGSDGRSSSYSVGLADAIKIIRVDFVEPAIQVLTFQRDLYVEIPGIEAHNNITHGKLSQAYLYGNPGYAYYDGEGQGPGLMALTLKQNFDAQIDHYVAVNLQTFIKIVDDLGGLDINLPSVIDGRVRGSRDPNRFFAAGKQHLNGYRTMLLARLRPRGDFQRAEVQNLILQAFAEKLFGLTSVLKLPELIKKYRNAVQTDLSPVEIGQLLCLRARLSKHAVQVLSFPDDLFKSDRVHDPVLGNTSIQAADFNILKIYVRRFNEGRWHGLVEHVPDESNP